ncbi:MAG: dienelactone hydrolase family protein [Methylococcales bacterium]
MTIQTQLIEYYDNGTLLEGFLAFDDKTRTQRAAVLIAHTWVGRNQAACNKAIQIAELGYVGFASDMYGKGIFGTNADENAALMQPFIDNRGLLQARMLRAIETLQQQPLVNPTQVAAVGYCFGGMCVLDLARTGAKLSAAVSVHGLLQQADNIEHNRIIHAKVLVLHGYQDPLAPPDDVFALQTELSAAKADWQIHLYGNSMHGFTNPLANQASAGILYNKVADKRAWRSITDFLNDTMNIEAMDTS